MTRVLVTGATSFIGRSLVPRLVASGSDVHLLLREDSIAGDLDSIDATIHRLSGDMSDLSKAVGRADPEVTVHLAGTYIRNHRADQIRGLVEDNLTFGVELLDALAGDGRRVVVALSYFQHADGATATPVNLYASIKQGFETVADFYHASGALDVTKLVLFDVYGESDPRPKLINAAVRAAMSGEPLELGAADALVAPVHVDDVCGAFELAAGLRSRGSEAARYAVRPARPSTVASIVETVEEVSGKEIQKRWGVFPASPAVRALWDGPPVPGWAERVDLASGVDRMIRSRAW